MTCRRLRVEIGRLMAEAKACVTQGLVRVGMGFLDDLKRETCGMSVPIMPLRWWGLVCGLLNFFFFGIGTIIAGIKANKAR